MEPKLKEGSRSISLEPESLPESLDFETDQERIVKDLHAWNDALSEKIGTTLRRPMSSESWKTSSASA